MKIILFLILLLSISSLYGQDTLLLHHPDKGKTIIIEEGKRIRARDNTGRRIVGQLEITHQDSILVGTSKIAIKNIASIYRARILPEIIGAGCITFGLSLIPIDLFFTLFLKEVFYYYTLSSIPFHTAGLSILLLHPKHKCAKGWRYKIKISKYESEHI